MKRTSWRLICVLMVLPALQAAAGDITLKNGDRLTGKIVEQNDEAVVIETVYAGKVRIDRSHIERISDAPAANTTALKETAVSAASAKVSGPPSSTAAPESAPAAAGTAKAAPLMAFKEPPRNRVATLLKQVVTGWDGNANIGFSFTSGNSNNITMTTGLRAAKINPSGGVTVYFRSLWNSTHGSVLSTTTQNAFWGGVRHDRNLSGKTFGFLSYDFERDKPRRLNFRSVVGGGLGRRVLRNDRTELELLAGLAWNRTWQTGADTNTPEGLAGMVFKHKLNSRLKFQNNFNFFQNVTDKTEYRIIFDTTVSVDVTSRVGIYFSLGDRFNNDPLGNSKKNDFLLTTGLKWNFGKKK